MTQVDRHTRCIVNWRVWEERTEPALQAMLHESPQAQPYFSDAFAVYTQWIYDPGQHYSIAGRVQRIEFSEHVFDAYVLADPTGPAPGRLFQVRSEYRFSREEIARRLTMPANTAKTKYYRGLEKLHEALRAHEPEVR